MIPSPAQYNYKVIWSQGDNQFVGTCAEFPLLSWMALSESGALEGIRKLVAEVVEDMRKRGEHIPPPEIVSDKEQGMTLEVSCDVDNCDDRAAFHGKDRWFFARAAGWFISEASGNAFCPKHYGDPLPWQNGDRP